MEIEVGDWIRSKDGFIGKVQKISYDNMEKSNYYICEKDNVMASNYLENIAKHSKNIIDLIEVGDYVNGKEVIMDLQKSKEWYKSKDDFITCKDYTFEEKEIKEVVTKEQFKSISYKVTKM